MATVPKLYPIQAVPAVGAAGASRKINKLRVLNCSAEFDSHPGHHFLSCFQPFTRYRGRGCGSVQFRRFLVCAYYCAHLRKHPIDSLSLWMDIALRHCDRTVARNLGEYKQITA